MSRRRRAGCFFTGGGGGASEQKLQDFQPSLRWLSPVRQWPDYLTVIFPDIPLFLLLIAELVIVNRVMLWLNNCTYFFNRNLLLVASVSRLKLQHMQSHRQTFNAALQTFNNVVFSLQWHSGKFVKATKTTWQSNYYCHTAWLNRVRSLQFTFMTRWHVGVLRKCYLTEVLLC